MRNVRLALIGLTLMVATFVSGMALQEDLIKKDPVVCSHGEDGELKQCSDRRGDLDYRDADGNSHGEWYLR